MALSPTIRSQTRYIHPVLSRGLLFAYSAIKSKDSEGKLDVFPVAKIYYTVIKSSRILSHGTTFLMNVLYSSPLEESSIIIRIERCFIPSNTAVLLFGCNINAFK